MSKNEDHPEYKLITESIVFSISQIVNFWEDSEKITGIENFTYDMLKMGTDLKTGEEEEEEFFKAVDDEPGETCNYALLHASMIAWAYTMDAAKAKNENDFLQAYRFLHKAMYWSGLLVGSMRESKKLTIKEFSMRGVEKRHEENRAMKQYVFDWLDQNYDATKSKDAIAQSIVNDERLVPMSFRTVRKWLGEWEKLRSASKE